MPVDRSLVFGETAQAVERIAPGFFPAQFEEEHLARYTWAAQWVRGKSVLDVACGTGYGSAMLLRAGASLAVAVELSAPALAFAARTYAGPKYICADARKIPLKDASFDAVVSLETIEHLADPVGFLRSVRALLREGGVLVLSMPNRSQTDGSNPYHLHEMTLPELLEALERASFGVTGLWGQHWRPPRQKRFWRMKGLGRLAYEIERHPRVWKIPASLGFEPLYWCIVSHAEEGIRRSQDQKLRSQSSAGFSQPLHPLDSQRSSQTFWGEKATAVGPASADFHERGRRSR